MVTSRSVTDVCFLFYYMKDVDKFCNSLAELYSNISKVSWQSQAVHLLLLLALPVSNTEFPRWHRLRTQTDSQLLFQAGETLVFAGHMYPWQPARNLGFYHSSIQQNELKTWKLWILSGDYLWAISFEGVQFWLVNSVGTKQLQCWGDITAMGRHNLGRQGNGATQPDTCTIM